jgi:hypothetical protein
VDVYLYSVLNLVAGWGGWSIPCYGRFTPMNDPVPIVQEAGWAPGRTGRVRKISPQPGFDPQTVQLVASRYADYTIPAHWTLEYT